MAEVGQAVDTLADLSRVGAVATFRSTGAPVMVGPGGLEPPT
jgi:hypothetical protein